jgi:hypothetical protein
MSVASTTDFEIPEPAGWTAWPAGERRGRTAMLMAADLALAVLAGAIGGDALWAATGLVLLLVSQNRWFLPTEYVVDAQALTAGFPLRRRTLRWADARLLVLDPAGGWLSGSRTSRRGGIDLYWGPTPEASRSLVRRRAEAAIASGVPIEIVVPGDRSEAA